MKVAALVSGGVDSSVALKLLVDQGHDVTAFYLKIWLEDDLQFLGNCPWEEDLGYVRALCEQLDVPLRIMPLQREYWESVVAYTIAEIRAGRTPNPDLFCNRLVKFGVFYDKIDAEFEKVATGHYARLEQRPDGSFNLAMAPDPIKDQTYFLSRLTQPQLARALFPIGDYQKSDVRRMAADFDLPTKERKDSQGICFLGTIRFSEFIKFHLGERDGALIEWETGENKGSHRGYWYFTIGQRQGIGLHGGPWYVVGRDIESNTIYISKSYTRSDRARNTCRVADFNWLNQTPEPMMLACYVKIRHGAHRYSASLLRDGDLGVVTLDGTDQGMAAGQFVVFYQGDTCLGSAVIAEDSATIITPA